VHGHIEEGERPWEAATRELEEETGMVPERLYNLSRVEAFYQHRKDEVALVPVFVAFVAPDTAVRLGSEHDDHRWLAPAEAGDRFAWPRERRALEDAVRLLGSGDGGAVEDVLRIC
jgi:8-oxo-dGTP pyrophosphatase MutT (NUDIX family)